MLLLLLLLRLRRLAVGRHRRVERVVRRVLLRLLLLLVGVRHSPVVGAGRLILRPVAGPAENAAITRDRHRRGRRGSTRLLLLLLLLQRVLLRTGQRQR